MDTTVYTATGQPSILPLSFRMTAWDSSCTKTVMQCTDNYHLHWTVYEIGRKLHLWPYVQHDLKPTRKAKNWVQLTLYNDDTKTNTSYNGFMIRPTYIKDNLWSYFIIIPHGWISELPDVRMTPLQIWISTASERGHATQLSFYARSQNSEKWLSASSFLSVRMEQLSPQWADFH